MPAPYSQDLRERVIGFVALGGSARAAATRFAVSISSAARWVQRWRAEGHARPHAMGGALAPGWASTARGCYN